MSQPHHDHELHTGTGDPKKDKKQKKEEKKRKKEEQRLRQEALDNEKKAFGKVPEGAREEPAEEDQKKEQKRLKKEEKKRKKEEKKLSKDEGHKQKDAFGESKEETDEEPKEATELTEAEKKDKKRLKKEEKRRNKEEKKKRKEDKKSGATNYQNDFNPEFMRRAIELSRRASIIEKSGGVFGAVIVKDGKIIAEGYNQVIRHNDPTWHAEMQAIREACKKLGSPHLKGCTMYTSAECCPMCIATAYWAHLDHIYYGATTEDALQYGDFQDIGILEELRLEPEERTIQFSEHMRPEAVAVWKEFSEMPDRARY